MALIDFTDCEIDLTANYGGSDKKRGVIYQGKRYMLKLSDRIPERKQNSLNSSYSNSAYSEYISCHVIETMGYEVQKTLLGTLRLMSASGTEQIYPVVACENFIPEDNYLVEFKFIEGAILESKPTKIPTMAHIYEVMTTPNAYFSKEFGKKALEAYWDLFIADALLGNFDRHANNWGYLVNKTTQEIRLAPVYDCGSCLYPQLSDDALERILNTKEEMQKRIDVFPTAALEHNHKKVSYKEFISSFENSDCTRALLRVAPRINMEKIHITINHTEGISELRKKFYFRMLEERYRQIILEPYLKAVTIL